MSSVLFECLPSRQPIHLLSTYTGKVKDEFFLQKTERVYPNGHSLWDKIECRGDLTLSEVRPLDVQFKEILLRMTTIVFYNY